MASKVEIFMSGAPLPFKDYKSKGQVFSSSEPDSYLPMWETMDDLTIDLKKKAAWLGANAIIGVEYRDVLIQVNGYFFSRRKTYK
jgi:hypothetical protein